MANLSYGRSNVQARSSGPLRCKARSAAEVLAWVSVGFWSLFRYGTLERRGAPGRAVSPRPPRSRVESNPSPNRNQYRDLFMVILLPNKAMDYRRLRRSRRDRPTGRLAPNSAATYRAVHSGTTNPEPWAESWRPFGAHGRRPVRYRKKSSRLSRRKQRGRRIACLV
jgi:hypothetical protein